MKGIVNYSKSGFQKKGKTFKKALKCVNRRGTVLSDFLRVSQKNIYSLQIHFILF